MKKLLIAAMMSSAFIATPALADGDDSDDFDVTASVLQECSLENPTDVVFGDLTINEEPGADALLITENESDTQRVWASCNFAAPILLASQNGGLENEDQVNDGPDADDFADVIHYRMSIEPSDGTAFSGGELQTSVDGTTTETLSQTDAFHDRARLRLRILRADQDGNRPLSGDYSDVATVALGAI